VPIYTFQHPETKEVIEVTQSMTDKHIYIDEKKTEWERVWNTNFQVGVVHQQQIQGVRKICNVEGKSIPKSEMKSYNRNFKYQYSCREIPDIKGLPNDMKSSL
tara:strand:+ start:130 stop:438 length:309 start_codon:yes stop_codon:yes gene_type:complete